MKKCSNFVIILFLLFSTVFCSDVSDSTDKSPASFYVANWNVENLFDTVDDPTKNDEWFTPESEIKWTEQKLHVKMSNLARLIKYMNNNPSAQAELTGYADQRGSEAYNTNLSTKRAEKVTAILVEAGIDAGRLTNNGIGETASANSKAALQLQRRVTFKLK